MRGVLVPALLVALAVVTFLAVVWQQQRRMLYFPDLVAAPPAASVLPGAIDIAFETEDRIRLSGYFVPPATPSSGVTAIVFNGNAGDRSHRVGLAQGLAANGHGVLLFDYRGYAGNAGAPTERGLAADARAALRYLESRDDVDAARIVYFGESLGAAVAASLAVERPPFALVLRSPFTSLAEVGRIHYPYLPVFDLLLFDRYPVTDAVRRVHAPVLVIAGEGDRLVPPALSRRVHEAAAGPKRFVAIDADHNDPALAEGPELLAAVNAFLADVARGTVP